MKLNDLISDFRIAITNEEKIVLDKLKEPEYIKNFQEREQYVLENLIRKNLVSKVYYKGEVVVVPDDRLNRSS
jgi:hypothetical protein